MQIYACILMWIYVYIIGYKSTVYRNETKQKQQNLVSVNDIIWNKLDIIGHILYLSIYVTSSIY